MSSQESSRSSEEDELFYTHCRAAYLAVFRSSLTNITSKQQLCRGKKTYSFLLFYACLLELKQFENKPSLLPLLHLLLQFPTFIHLALQQAGRNPSLATLDKYWTSRRSTLNFDDFCEILQHEKKTDEPELMRAFKKFDVNGDGYITHSELERALTTVSHVKH